MRSAPALVYPFALIACAFFSVPSAQAQQPVPPAAETAAVTAVTEPVPLLIPAPPGAKLRVEMDARSEDLLGMVKAFLTGIGETGTQPKTPGQPASPPNPIADVLQAGNLAEVLKDVNHVHFVVYELPSSPVDVPAPPMAVPGKLHPKPAALTLAAVPTIIPALPKFDSNAFYEDAFSHEGAHRILFTDADEYKLVMVGFPDKHGFAFAVSGGGYVAVSRTDGYPNLEALSSFLSHVTTAVMNSKTAKKLMDAGINSGLGTTDKPSAPGAGGDEKK